MSYPKIFLEIVATHMKDNVHGNKLLIESIKTNVDYDTFILLIKEVVDVNSRDEKGFTALTYAYEAGRNDLFEALIHAGADVNIKDRKGNYLLTSAIRKNNARIVNYLLEAGANANHKDKSGVTDLTHAIVSKQRNVVSDLINHGANVNAKNEKGDTPLMLAVERDLLISYLLISSGANINDRNKDGTTALMKISSISSHRGPESLIGYYSFPFKLIDWSIAKLSGTRDLIAVSDIPKVIDTLLNAGAEIEAKDNRGETALMYAAKHGTVDRVAQLIKKRGFILKTHKGADINAKDNKGYTSLMHAINQNCFETFEYLLRMGADFRNQARDGETALSLARKFSRKDYVKVLIETGARF